MALENQPLARRIIPAFGGSKTRSDRDDVTVSERRSNGRWPGESRLVWEEGPTAEEG